LEGLRLRPGLAMSQDGKNWARIEAEHHTGALFDVGAEGEWDQLFVGGPQVGRSASRPGRPRAASLARVLPLPPAGQQHQLPALTCAGAHSLPPFASSRPAPPPPLPSTRRW
jgi:hypothetical protein